MILVKKKFENLFFKIEFYSIICVFVLSYAAINSLPIITVPRNLIIRGSSLEGIAENGRVLEVASTPKNKKIDRNSLLIYKPNNRPHSLVKVAKGISGDLISFDLNRKLWELYINGEKALTSSGDVYAFNFKKYRTIERELENSNGRIPENNVLLLGNLAAGSFDSTEFGLAKVDRILGIARIK